MGWMRATIPGAPEAPRLGALHARGRAPQDIECTFDARLGRIIDPHLAKGQEFFPSETRWRSTTRKEVVPKGGLEPPRVAPHAPQTCASANSATSAPASDEYAVGARGLSMYARGFYESVREKARAMSWTLFERRLRRRNLRIGRLGRSGPSPWPSCGSHCVLGGRSEGGRSPPPSVLAARAHHPP